MAFRSPNDPPRGWHAQDGLLAPDPSVSGYAARGQEVHGRCHQRDCRRTCHIDMRALDARGYGRLHVEVVRRFLRCQRFDGCALDFHEEPKIGLPLRAITGRAHVLVRFSCRGCKLMRTAVPEAVLAKLARTPRGTDDATVEELSKLTTAPCKGCGKVNWQVDVLWPNINSAGYRASLGSG